jgi:acetylornithine/succinyldiaminopimelate/putrescine aminotransferase
VKITLATPSPVISAFRKETDQRLILSVHRVWDPEGNEYIDMLSAYS